jgi:peptide/nickel transport system permease protein
MIRHILPDSFSPVLVISTLSIGSTILSAAALSYLGLGIPAPTPEWGSMLSNGRQFMGSAPYLTIFPGIAIVISVLAFNLLGDGIRDGFDPRLKKKIEI